MSRRGRAAAALLFAFVALAGLTGAATAAVPSGGRAWELVTPAEPLSVMISNATSITDDGERVLYDTLGSLPGAPAGANYPFSLGVRGAAGWRTDLLGGALSTRKAGFGSAFGKFLQAASADLSTFILSSAVPFTDSPGAPPEGQTGLYRARVGEQPAFIAGAGEEAVLTSLASADVSHFVFLSRFHLLPGDEGRTSGSSVYESVGSGLRLVDVADDGSLLSKCGSTIEPGGVSASGERVFFSVLPCAGVPRRVYMRESGARTVELSASRCTRPDCNAPSDVNFVGATQGGSVVYLVTGQQLIDGDLNARRDLYRFDVGSEALELVSPGAIRPEGEVGLGRVLGSADGSRVYFRSTGSVLPGPGGGTGDNLYVSDAQGPRLVAALSSNDPATTTPDGRFAVLTTARQLTGEDLDTKQDVYRYDAETGEILRLSAGPGGGNGAFAASAGPAAAIAEEPLDRPVTADGGTVFFDTAEPLLAEDRNQAIDVYEWSHGELGLVSAGSGELAAELAGTTPDGGTVLIRTAAALLPRDRDGGDNDLYAARVGGGFAEDPGTAEPCGQCDGGGSGTISRPSPASAGPPEPRKGRLRLLPIGPALGRDIAAGRRPVIKVAAPAPGRVAAAVRGTVSGRLRTLARGVGGALRPGRVRLALAVDPAARRQLVRKGELRLRLVVRQGALQAARDLTVRPGAGR